MQSSRTLRRDFRRGDSISKRRYRYNLESRKIAVIWRFQVALVYRELMEASLI